MQERVFNILFAALAVLSAATCVTAQTNSQPNSQANPPAEQRANTQSETTPSASPQSSLPANNASPINFIYEFNQPQFLISHIRVEHDAAGRGQFRFKRRGETEYLTEALEISSVALARIANLWSALGFLESGVSYQAPREFPHLGTSRLAVRGATGGAGSERTTEFNWTSDRSAFALVTEYRRLADQALFVFEINLARENRPLETPSLMTRLESLVRRDGLSDARQLVPLLRDLSTDERLPLIARSKAERLIRRLEGRN